MAQRLSDIMNPQPIRLSDIPREPTRLSDIGGAAASGSFGVGSLPEEKRIDVLRFGKRLYNIIPETIEGILKTATRLSPGHVEMMQRAQEEILAGSLGPEEAERARKWKEKGEQRSKTLQPTPIAPPNSIGEKATDIAAGVVGFVAKLALLKKAYPKLGGAGLWEMENLMSGGTPGVGAATYGVFNLPGRVIKGVSVAAKAGRVASESALLGGLSATHQKIATGEIDATEVLISAGIPIGLRAAGGAKGVLSRALKARSPKALKAVNDIVIKQYIKRNPTEAKHYKALIAGVKDDKVVKALLNKAPRLFDIPDSIKFDYQGRAGAQFRPTTNSIHINPRYNLTPQKMARTLLHELMHAYRYNRKFGAYVAEWETLLTKYKLHGKSVTEINKFLRKLPIEEYQKLPTEERAYRTESLVSKILNPTTKAVDKINIYKTESGSRKGIVETDIIRKGEKYIDKVTGEPVVLDITVSGSAIKAQTPAEGIEATNQKLIDAIVTSKLLTKTEVKIAHKALRRKQAARGWKATKAAIKAGRSAGETIAAGRRAYGGKAKVPKITPPDLTPAEWEGYYKKILEVYPVSKKRTQFGRTGAKEALDKLRVGDIPGNYNIGLLEPVLGTDATVKLFEALQSKKGLELWDIPTLIRDVPKALRFGFDPQAARGLSKITIRHPLIYLSALGKNIRGVFSKKYTDAVSKTIEASPAYKLGQKEYGANYLSMRPWASVEAGTKLEQYGHISEIFRRSNSRIIKGIGTWLRASERGANLGMNDALNKLVIKGEKDLARYSRNKTLSDKQIASWRKARGHDINIFTKRITMKHPKGKAIQRAANWLVFSPSYTASGLASGPQSFLRLATGKGFASRTYAMQIMLSRLAGLTAASSAIGYVGHKWRLKHPTEEPPIDSSANPIDPLFGKVRQGLEVYDLGFGDVADYRLMARIGLSAYMGAKKALTGKEITSIGGKKIPTAGESFGRYLASKRTLYISLAKQLATGKDWLGRPVTLKDTALDNLPFEFFQAFVEAGAADGLWESMAEGIDLDTAKKTLGNLAPAIAALGGVGTGSYPTYTSVTRSKFRSIIAEKEYNKGWDDLTQTEQRKLSTKHRKTFSAFEQKIKVERIEKPANLAAIQEEQRKSGVKITKLLSKSNREKIKDVSVKVSRRPKNFYLNDERYQQYQELVAKYIDERLSRIKLVGKSDNVRIRMLEITVKMAKAKAFRDIRREMR